MGLAIIGVAFLFALGSCQECGTNEEYNECGTACPPTCENPDPQICTMQCVSGCFCKAGFLRDGQNNCVDPSQCPSSSSTTATTGSNPRCGKNEQWSNAECVPPPFCQAHCPNLPQVACKLDCSKLHGGCVCKNGYIRNENDKCIRESQC